MSSTVAYPFFFQAITSGRALNIELDVGCVFSLDSFLAGSVFFDSVGTCLLPTTPSVALVVIFVADGTGVTFSAFCTLLSELFTMLV